MINPRNARKPHKAITAKTSSIPRWTLDRLRANMRRKTAKIEARPRITAIVIDFGEESLYCAIMMARKYSSKECEKRRLQLCKLRMRSISMSQHVFDIGNLSQGNAANFVNFEGNLLQIRLFE